MSKLKQDEIQTLEVDQNKRDSMKKLALGAAAIPFAFVVYADADKMRLEKGVKFMYTYENMIYFSTCHAH